MKLEKLRNDKRKKLVIGVVITVCLVSTFLYVGSRAKYRVTDSIPLVNGTVNYELGDFNIIAMYKQKEGTNCTEDECYEEMGEMRMPDEDYIINEERSYCNVNGEEDQDAKLYTNANGEHVIANLQKKSKCYLYFDKHSVKKVDTVLGTIMVNKECNDTSVYITTGEEICVAEDDWGTTYYWRGVVTNNWFKLGDNYYRIIRVNGDGSVRLIYNGPTTDQTGETTQISKSAYNSKYNDNAFVGYMYGSVDSDNYEATHANTNDSKIKTVVDTWYKENIVDKNLSKYISTEAGFCNDREISTTSRNNFGTLGYGTNPTAYAPIDRTSNNSWGGTFNPTFKCTNKNNDLFTTNESSLGNKMLTYPIGLITLDEILFSGYRDINRAFYLYTNQDYWTMSPWYSNSNEEFTYVFYMGSGGSLINSGWVSNTRGVRPVLNIAKDATITGSGTTLDPYTIAEL